MLLRLKVVRKEQTIHQVQQLFDMDQTIKEGTSSTPLNVSAMNLVTGLGFYSYKLLAPLKCANV